MKNRLNKYIQYLKNVGGPIKQKDFDYDWEPIGPTIRADLRQCNIIEEDSIDGYIYLKRSL